MQLTITADDIMKERAETYPWSDADDALKTILMVGAIPDEYSDFPLSSNDRGYLMDFLSLAQKFKLPVSRDFNIVSCNLTNGEDFLRQYGSWFDDEPSAPKVDAIIFCYLYFSPHATYDHHAPMARQSPHANSEKIWREALKGAAPKAALNIAGYDELPTRLLNHAPLRHIYEDVLWGKHFLLHQDWADTRGLKEVPDTSTHFADNFSNHHRSYRF